MRNLSIILLATIVLLGCKKDFLERPPLDQLTDNNYWTNENNVRTFAWGFYPAYFSGYGSGFTWGRYFSGQSLNDDFAPSAPDQFTKTIPSKGGGWSFTWVRKANILINRVQGVPMSDEAKAHWTGIGRFFRGMEYFDLVSSFGDVPWYGHEMDENSPDLYRARDPRTNVMDSVLADFKYAAANVRESDGAAGLTVNKYVVLAFMSRVFLFEGTYEKYHNINQTKATEFLEASKWAAEQVMTSGKYSLNADYRKDFNSMALAGNKEMLLFREYTEGLLTHSLNSYVNLEPQSGISKDAVESYLASDGLPISISPLYKGDKTIGDLFANRDGRMYKTVVPTLRLNGEVPNYSTSGYSILKFLNDDIKDQAIGSSNLNPTDAPVIRYGEVLINYAEATAELGNMTQQDLDLSVNVLRNRADVKMPPLTIGVGFVDPDRDPTVSPLLWEIRRERRVELMMEGFRLDDLKRWKKLEYTDTKGNPDINKGAWVVKAEHPKMKDIKIENDAAAGYIIPAWKPESQRMFTDPKVYLDPLPLDQIKLYLDQGVTLTQNPGWQ